jgi:hypothetical protein
VSHAAVRSAGTRTSMAQEMMSLRTSARNGTVAVLYWYLPPSLDSCMRMPPEEVSTVSSTAPMAFCRSVGPPPPPLLPLLGDDACVGEATRDACEMADTPLSGALHLPLISAVAGARPAR